MSDILAELFVIAITVVLAASLFVLIVGLTHATAPEPYLLSMGDPQENTQSTGYSYGVISISPEAGLTTSMAGLSLMSGSGGAIAVGSAPLSTCRAGAGFYNATAPCAAPASGVWYAVLVNGSSGMVVNVWSLQPGATVGWSGPPMAFAPAQEIVVVWGSSYGLAGSADSLHAYSLSSSSVSGESGSF